MKSTKKWKRGDLAYCSVPCISGGVWSYKPKGPFRIIGIVDGYAVARFSRAMPFCVAVSDLMETPDECLVRKSKRRKIIENDQ